MCKSRPLLALVFCFLCQLVLAEESIEKRMDFLFGEHEKHIAFFHQLKDSVVRDERKKVAELVHYPLNVYIRDKHIIVRSKGEFLKRYREVFNENVVRAIKSQEAKDLFANWRGVMLGKGQVWFAGICIGREKGKECANMTIKVITVNTDAPS